MAAITPTITTADAHEYREQMERISTFSEGVHVDFADGVFAPTKLLPLSAAWRTDDLITHAHIMYQDPLPHVDDMIDLEADLVVLHAESENVKQALEKLRSAGARTGIALLPETSIEELEELDLGDLYDHVLIFAGHLGYQGGAADPLQLEKVREIKRRRPDVEIGWDGGINADNIQIIVGAGVSILNVGGSIKSVDDPKKAYDELVSLVS